MFVIISFPILFDLYEEFKKLGVGVGGGGGGFYLEATASTPPCVDAPV